jgi:cobalt-zinc-cadmium efflux system membrane fusion protein
MKPQLLAAPALGLVALVGYQTIRSSGVPGRLAARPTKAVAAGASSSRVGVVQDTDHGPSSTILATGRVTFDETRVAHVLAPVSGSVARVEVRVGERIGEGTPLAVISSRLVDAISDELTAQADVAAADGRYQRQREFYRVHANTEGGFEAARTARQQARAVLDRARERVSLMQLGDGDATPQETILRSPIGGRVLAISVSPGDKVRGKHASGGGQRLFTVGDLSSVWVVADVSEADLASIRVGTPVWVTVPGAQSERKLTGQVAWISAAVDPGTCTTTVRCAVHNPDGTLKPGVETTVSIAAGR